MNITFQINYRTEYGQHMCIVEASPSVLGWTEAHPLRMNCQGSDFWTVNVQVPHVAKVIHYRYAICLEDGRLVYETGEPHELRLTLSDQRPVVRDYWQTADEERPFYTAVFVHALCRRKGVRRLEDGSAAACSLEDAPETLQDNVHFSITLPLVQPNQGVAIMGNIPELGMWDKAHKVIMSDQDYPLWCAKIHVTGEPIIEYKYCIYDLTTGEVVDLEYGENRQIWGMQKDVTIYQNDRSFRRTQPRFKGAGVAVPIFSLRTEQSFGIGEFQDLKKLAEWASHVGLKMIQTLPINDTTLTHTHLDSYPYNAVSVFALHPIYINVEQMGHLTPARLKSYRATQQLFNAKATVDYQSVYDEKMKYFKALFKQDKEAVFAGDEYKAFFAKNEQWLVPYAQFLHKRDKQPVELYYFLQFHADKQLTEAIAYVHSLGIAMKGDIPIGISPDSVDAYTDPDLFNLDASAGAPPDDFDARGQNWGFPTYNWDVMAKDNYDWWRRRFTKMQDYFDAYRVDHILGFFRIWQMRKCDVWGLCGHFSPALPYSLQDLWNMGVQLDEDRMTRPYIRSNFLEDVFGCDTDYVKEHFLDTHDGYVYFFREAFDTQRKVLTYFEKGEGTALPEDRRMTMMNGLLGLHCEVLFVRDQKDDSLLHPRISIYHSRSFNELYDDQKQVLMGIYNDYFFHRHNAFWRQSALRKLPTLISSTDMLCCGEDLGMVPACVPDVMHELQILSLEIQRMPKNPAITFAHPCDAPYLSVCTTGTHDTSPLRAWWEEDREKTQRFYNEQMGYQGEAPQTMTPKIAAFIIHQHMYSPAMWVILPLQDWLAIDGDIRLEDASAERINIPSEPHHLWNYRMHISVEQLIQAQSLNNKIIHLTFIRL